MRRLVAITVAAVALLAACTDSEDAVRPTTGTSGPGGSLDVALVASALQPFDACEDLGSWARAEAAERVGPYGLDTGYGGGDLAFTDDDVAVAPGSSRVEQTTDGSPIPTTAPATDTAEESTTAGDSGDGATSGTNVQEAGVDEPDLVKTDGTLLVTVVDGTLRVVDVSDDTPVQLATLPLTEGAAGADQLFLSGDRALLLSSGGWYGYGGVDDATTGVPAPGGTTLTLVDLADPTAPTVVSSASIDGQLLDARMSDGRIRVVTTSTPQVTDDWVYPSSSSASAERRAEAANRSLVEETDAEDWLPAVYVADGDGSGGDWDREPLLDCASVRHPAEFAGFGTLAVLTVDPASAAIDPADSVGILASGETVYASAEHLYVTTSTWPDPVVFEDADALAEASEGYGTDIHRFSIADPGPAVYEGSGRVRGRLLNQFSLSEHDGVLRVATTDGSPWGPTGSNESFVTTLALTDGALVQQGQVGDMGRGEQIYAVRFLGTTGYVVTFRQTDPLYTLDLSDPADPRVVGELKVPGYSAYLHPLGDGRLLGIGQDADADGRVLGLKVSLFDVSDPAAPAELATWVLPDASSEVEYEHHAFLWWGERDLAVLPVQRYDWSTGAENGFTGAIGLRVDDGIAERGRLTHQAVVDQGWYGCPPDALCEDVLPVPDTVAPETTLPATTTTTVACNPQQQECPEPGPGPEPGPVPEPVPGPTVVVDVPIARSLVVHDRLLTLSSAGIALNDLDTFEQVGWLTFS